MNRDNYSPSPIDTSHVAISAEVEQLMELLARNTHEVWAKGRMDAGWTYGEQRDDARKKHPCLVPYEDLPEEEKEYDRRTAMEAIRTIMSLGFLIAKDEGRC